MANILVHLFLLLALPPLLSSVIAKTKAFFAGRVGPRLLQPYYDLAKLARKGSVFSRTTTWVFRTGPIATLAAVLLAGLLMPLGPFDAPLRFVGDFVFFAYLFGLARFCTTAAALDTGSAFEGMGAAREVTFACLSEPALFLAFLVLARLSGAASLTPMLHAPESAQAFAAAPLVLVSAGLFIVLLAENCRIPVDDPNTHLELTMIHEVMVLDHGGPLFGMILYAAAVKLFVLSSLVLHLLAPVKIGIAALDWGVFVLEVLVLAALVGVVESTIARLRMDHVPVLLLAACLLGGLGFVLLVG
jgi:formate hydrogenlyase subunit 4